MRLQSEKFLWLTLSKYFVEFCFILIRWWLMTFQNYDEKCEMIFRLIGKFMDWSGRAFFWKYLLESSFIKSYQNSRKVSRNLIRQSRLRITLVTLPSCTTTLKFHVGEATNQIHHADCTIYHSQVFPFSHSNTHHYSRLFVNWAAKFIDGQQNYLFGQQKIYFFGQPLS
jgi:hypothetical protein